MTESQKKSIQNLRKQIREIQAESDRQCHEEHFENFNNMVGKFFKLNISYSGEDSFDLYCRIDSVKKGSVMYANESNVATCEYICFTFMEEESGEIKFNLREEIYNWQLKEVIPEWRFVEAFNSMIAKIKKFVPESTGL